MKPVVVKTEDEKIFKEFKSVGECADFFNVDKGVIYRRSSTPQKYFLESGVKLRFIAPPIRKLGERKDGIDGRIKDKEEIELRKNETEDQTRRRLGLNPYGSWRNDKWLFEMFDRVNKQLYPDGYDAHAAWLAEKGQKRIKEGRTRVAQEVMYEVYKDIDDEFLDYIR